MGAIDLYSQQPGEPCAAGGNTTGLSMQSEDTIVTYAELREILPRAMRIAVLTIPRNAFGAIARVRGLRVRRLGAICGQGGRCARRDRDGTNRQSRRTVWME